jgi:uncharacterized protein (DUF1330 family)
MFLLCLAIFIVASHLQTDSLFLSIGVKVVLLLSFPVLLHYLNFYNSNEVEIFKKLRTGAIRKVSLIINGR